MLRYCCVLVVVLVLSTALAQTADHAYTTLDLQQNCQWQDTSDEEVNMGGSAICTGYEDYPVHVAEGDLRQFVAYGPASEPLRFWQSFSQFNHVNNIVEWRLQDGKPVAAILRYFIDNQTPATGIEEGQVLVISTVANPAAPPDQRTSCIAAYVDARTNPDANTLARQIANSVAPGFVCGQDQPRYHGERGPAAGNPS